MCSIRCLECLIISPILWIMVKNRPVSSDDIGAIASLYKAEHSVNGIAEDTGIGAWLVKWWVFHLSNGDGEALPRKVIKPGRPCKTHPESLNIIMHNVKKYPTSLWDSWRNTTFHFWVKYQWEQRRGKFLMTLASSIMWSDISLSSPRLIKKKTAILPQVPCLWC